MKTHRLYFRKPNKSDADFIRCLVNDPDWLRYIGDKVVNSRQDAVRYIAENLNAKQYNDLLGLRLCCIRGVDDPAKSIYEGMPIGLCGLLKRDYLDSVDIGYAFASAYRGFGYAIEAVSFFKACAFNDLQLDTLYATVSIENKKSISLLKKLDFTSVGGLIENDIESQNVALYACYAGVNPPLGIT
jgi:RimJ/RimL family protein N-acetyltransferase